MEVRKITIDPDVLKAKNMSKKDTRRLRKTAVKDYIVERSNI